MAAERPVFPVENSIENDALLTPERQYEDMERLLDFFDARHKLRGVSFDTRRINDDHVNPIMLNWMRQHGPDKSPRGLGFIELEAHGVTVRSQEAGHATGRGKNRWEPSTSYVDRRSGIYLKNSYQTSIAVWEFVQENYTIAEEDRIEAQTQIIRLKEELRKTTE